MLVRARYTYTQEEQIELCKEEVERLSPPTNDYEAGMLKMFQKLLEMLQGD